LNASSAPLGRRMWTPLPALPLLNIGTPFVESVEHYVARLTWTIGIGVSSILSLDPPYDEPGYPTSRRSSFCGPGTIYKRRISNLQELTGVSTIHCGSFQALDALLASGALQGKQTGRRWCPECFKDWNELNSCEPLQWAIDMRVTCPIHGCKLEDSCQQCGAKQPRRAQYQLRRSCSTCQADLGGNGKFVALPAYTRWQEVNYRG